MKKFFTAIGWTLLYLLIFIVIQMIVTVGITVVVMALNPAVLSAAMEGDITQGMTLIMRYGVYIVGISAALLIPVILLIKPYDVTLKEGFGLRRAGWKNILCAVAVSAGIYLLLSVFLSAVPWPEQWIQQHEFATDSVTGGNLPVNLFFTVLLVPIMEEILFRGAIYGALKRGMPTAAALFFQAAAFGLLHGNPIQFCYAFLLALVLGLVFERTRSIWVPATIHMVINGAAILLSSVGETQYTQFMDQPYVGFLVLTGCALFAILGVVGFFCFNRPAAKAPGAGEYGEIGGPPRL